MSVFRVMVSFSLAASCFLNTLGVCGHICIEETGLRRCHNTRSRDNSVGPPHYQERGIFLPCPDESIEGGTGYAHFHVGVPGFPGKK